MFNTNTEPDTPWLPVSDLMSGLMVIFLFFSLLFFQMDTVQEQAVIVEKVQKANLGQKIETFIQPNLDSWNAAYIDSTFTVQFYTRESILFKQGKSELSPNFKSILTDFFPAYMHTLQEAEALNWIQELRIEGHSSSDGSYFNNMQLSQQRANAVLQYIWGLPNFSLIWEDGKEHIKKSRRVTFSLVLKSETAKRLPLNTPIFCHKSIIEQPPRIHIKTLSIPIRNTSNHSLYIKGVITSKDFTVLSWPKQPLLLGERTSITVAYSPTNDNVFQEYSFRIITDKATLPVKVNLKPYLQNQ